VSFFKAKAEPQQLSNATNQPRRGTFFYALGSERSLVRKTVLISGGNALLAQEVKRQLSGSWSVVTAGRDACDVFMDVSRSVEIPAGMDAVIHCAANFGGITDEKIDAALETNVHGLLKICQAALKAGVKHIINISSIFAILSPDSPGYSIYALTKKHADELADYYCTLNRLPLLTLRPSRIYGDGVEFARNQPFLYHIIDRVERGEGVVLYGAHDPLRNYIHCRDVGEVISRSLACGITGTFPCTFPENTTYAQITAGAARVFGQPGGLAFAEDKPDIPDDIHPFDSSLYERIGFVPGISMELGLQRIKQHRDRGLK
jgi:nucleoside-diphosphate-sugar epimerase